MTIRSNNFEGGTATTAVAAGQTGSGDPLDTVTITNAATVTYDTTHAMHGTKAALVTPTSTGQARLDYRFTSSAIAARAYIYLTALPAADTILLQIITSAFARAVSWHVNSVGKLRLSDSSGTTGVFTAAATIPLNQWVRLELFATPGVDITSGTLKGAVYLGDSTTPIEAAYSSPAANTGTAAFGGASAGRLNLSAYVTQFWVDDFAANDAAADLMGPAANAAPTVGAGANQNVAAGATVTLTGTATDSDGTIAARSWAFDYPTSGAPTLTGATTATATFTAGAAGSLYVLRHTATDDKGATGSATTEVRVPDSGTMTPLPTAATGGFTRVGSATTDGGALADTDDTTYLESTPVSATVQTMRIRCEPITTRSGFTVTARLAKSDTGNVTCTVRLVEGTTVRQTWSDVTVTQTATDFTRTVTTPAAISDWGNLYLEITAAS